LAMNDAKNGPYQKSLAKFVWQFKLFVTTVFVS
jgi:hypothetical protein